LDNKLAMGFVKLNLLNKKKQLTDFFTKLLAKDKFSYLRTKLGILDLSNVA